MLYDVFICHASEDKDSFVRPLAEKLRENHVEVWYDEFSLKVGDSLRRSINKGLSKSRYGIVVLSKNFFKKEWPQRELDGLVQIETTKKAKTILPIWHDITKEEVLSYSPPLADKYALPSDRGLDFVVSELLKIIQPEGSTLIIARDILLEYGHDPPVVTDDWWLDMVEFQGTNPYGGELGNPYTAGRWHFRLAWGPKPTERGNHLAWYIMQTKWQEKADENDICQISHPEKVLSFIKSIPELKEICHEQIDRLALWAPQLTIKGLGGEFEKAIEELYQISLKEHKEEQEINEGEDKETELQYHKPSCSETFALRHPNLGGYKPSTIAYYYFLGKDTAGIWTPDDPTFYPPWVNAVWLLSSKSDWLPENIRKSLLEGLKRRLWAIGWDSSWGRYDFGFKEDTSTETDLLMAMWDAEKKDEFILNNECKKDIETHFSFTIGLLGLEESVDTLIQRFLTEGFIEAWLRKRKGARR